MQDEALATVTPPSSLVFSLSQLPMMSVKCDDRYKPHNSFEYAVPLHASSQRPHRSGVYKVAGSSSVSGLKSQPGLLGQVTANVSKEGGPAFCE